MNNENQFDIAVIGAGAAGSMGALRAVLNNQNTLCFTGSAKDKKRSRASWVGKVENMPLMHDMKKAIMGSSRDVFKWINSEERWKEKLTVAKESVEKIEGQKKDFTLTTDKGNVFHAKYILICTGIMDIQPEIQGAIDPIFPMANRGDVEYCIRCDGHKTKGKDTAVIGHSEVAGWVASLLKERYDNPSMHILTNGKPLEVEKDSSLDQQIKAYGFKVHESPIKEVLGDPKGEGLEGFLLEDGNRVNVQMAFVSLGSLVYNKLAKDMGCEVDDRGYALTDEAGESNVPGIFIAGDLRANKKKQIYTGWDMAVDSVDKVDRYLREDKRKILLEG